MLEAPLSSNDTKATHVDNRMRRGFAYHPFKLSGPSSLNAPSTHTPLLRYEIDFHFASTFTRVIYDRGSGSQILVQYKLSFSLSSSIRPRSEQKS